MYAWVNPNLELRHSTVAGGGMFACRNLPQGERLIVFGGHVMTLEQEAKLPESIADCAHQIDDDLVIGIACVNEAGPSDRVNHACDPNAGFDGQIALIALRNIGADEEITFDYAMCLSDELAEQPYRMECLCGSPRCRKFVTGNDWKLPELQTRYAGYFQPYLQKKIDRIRQATHG